MDELQVNFTVECYLISGPYKPGSKSNNVIWTSFGMSACSVWSDWKYTAVEIHRNKGIEGRTKWSQHERDGTNYPDDNNIHQKAHYEKTKCKFISEDPNDLEKHNLPAH